MSEVNISVIMPLYNAEKYLEEALESVKEQTYPNFEIICINDASTDTTVEILHKYQKLDKRMRIIENHERLGAAISRNKGIREARGKYLIFLDGDDVFDEEMLKSAYETIEKYSVDIVMFEYLKVSNERIHEKRSIPRSEKFIAKYCKKPFTVLECEPIEFTSWHFGPCDKLYRKDFICENQLEFQTLSSSNDVYFVEMAYFLAGKIIMLDDRRVMLYNRDHAEPTRISYDRDPMCAYLADVKIGNELIDRGMFPSLFQYYYCRLYYRLRLALMKTKKRENAELFYDFLRKEGVENFLSLSEEYYRNTDSYIRNLLGNFNKLEFSSGWYKDEGILAFYLNRNADRVLQLFQSYVNRDARIALWGAGENGNILLGFLQKHNLQIAEVVDRSEKKQGMKIRGYEVRKPEAVLDNIQVVCPSTYSIYEEVLKELKESDVEVIDINSCLQEIL